MDYNTLSSKRAGFFSRFGTQEHTDRIMDSDNNAAKIAALTDSNNIRPEHIDKVMGGNDITAKRIAINTSKHITKKHLSDAIKSGNSGLIINALAHPLAPENELTKAIKSDDHVLNSAVMRNPSANEKHIEIALKSKDQKLKAWLLNIKTSMTIMLIRF